MIVPHGVKFETEMIAAKVVSGTCCPYSFQLEMCFRVANVL